MTKKPHVWIHEDVPTYALCYLVNDDDSGITKQDKINIMQWQLDLQEQLKIDHPRSTIMYPLIFGEEEYFDPQPAFGLPTTCVTCTIYTIRKRKTK